MIKGGDNILHKVLIVGGNGFVGGRLWQVGVNLGHTVAVLDRLEQCKIEGCAYYRCDISRYDEVEEACAAFRPNLVINVAAIADIDVAQQQQSLAYAVNVTGAKNCARAAKKVGAGYVCFSSDAVFSGAGAPYTEQSLPSPVNYYGETKRLAEEAVLTENPNAIVLRPSLILGLPIAKGNSFIASMLRRIDENQNVVCPVREIRTPIDVFTLAEAIYELYEINFRGLLHLGATESIDRYSLAKLIAQKAGREGGVIVPLDASDPTKAPRHEQGILDVQKAQTILKRTKLLSIEQTVDRAIEQRKW